MPQGWTDQDYLNAGYTKNEAGYWQKGETNISANRGAQGLLAPTTNVKSEQQLASEQAAADSAQAYKEQFKAPILGNFATYGGAGDSREAYMAAAAKANAEREQMRGYGAAAANRVAPQIDHGGNVSADRGQMYMNFNTDYKNAIGLARDAAMGNAPSVAAIQQRQGIEEAMRSQATMAASAAGSPLAQAAAAQNAQANAGMLAQRGVADAGMLRAQEMATARQQYGALTDSYSSQLANLRAQEVGMNVHDADLKQNQYAINDKGALGYYGLQQQGDIAQAQLQADALDREMRRQGYATDQAKQWVGAATGGLSSALGAGMMAFAPKSTPPGGVNSDIRGKTDIQFADDPMGNSGLPKPPPVGVRVPSGTMSIEQMQAQMPGAQPAAPDQQAMNAYKQEMDDYKKMQGLGKDLFMGGLQGMTSSLMQPSPYLRSDIRGKENVQPVGSNRSYYRRDLEDRPDPDAMRRFAQEVMSNGDPALIKRERVPGNFSHAPQNMSPIDGFLDATKKSASTYSYKDPAQEPRSVPTGGKYAGVMAQALEKVPQIGPQLVSNQPNGKVLERDAVLSAALAGIGRQQQQIDALVKRDSTDANLTPEESALYRSLLARTGGK